MHVPNAHGQTLLGKGHQNICLSHATQALLSKIPGRTHQAILFLVIITPHRVGNRQQRNYSKGFYSVLDQKEVFPTTIIPYVRTGI